MELMWSDIESAIRQIAFYLKRNLKDYNMEKPNIFGIPRGGLIPAVMLSHKLEFHVITNFEDIGDNTIIIDDIVDSGKTIDEYLKKYSPLSVVSIAYRRNRVFTPNCWVFEKFDDWMVFPWEKEL